VNADDYGYTPDVSEGIIAAHNQGIVTSATLMVTAAGFDHAVALARGNPNLGVGCHLTLVGSACIPGMLGPLPASLGQLARWLAAGRLRVEDEFEAQVGKMIDAGLNPSHLDTHKHTYMFPAVAEALGKISAGLNIPWVRRPLHFPVVGSCLVLALAQHGCRMADHFVGFRQTGRLEAAELVRIIHELQPGVSELMCHPGYLGSALRGAPTRLKESRERELQALTSLQVKEAVQQAQVRLTSYVSLNLQSHQS
jgi:predicted glycoside hydrolase/deacetylase ChbG (UPF0249 family)